MAVSSDSLRLAVVEETVVGEIPTTPTWNLFRTTGEGLTYNVETIQSDEMGGLNRGVKDNILVGASVSGDLNFELSKHTALEDFMSAAMGNTWGGDPLLVPGAGVNKAYDASTMRTFGIEKRFTLDESVPTYSFHRFTGCTVNTLNLSITPNEAITGSFGFMGNEMVTEGTEVAGSTYVSAGANPVMTAPLVTGLELLSPAGIDNTTGDPLGTAVSWFDSGEGCFTGLDITLNNNLRALACIGSLGTTENVLGRFEGTGSGSLYYGGDEPLDALINQTEYALRVTCTDDDGESFQFLFPRVAFSDASALATGTNTDVMTEFTLTVLEYQGDTYALSALVSRSSDA